MPEVIFTGPAGRIEGRYHPSKTKGAPIAIVLHPHPQFGGTMNNQIVYHLYYAFAERGLSVLRFNFRGVGRSQGSFDNGIGELSDAEMDAYLASGEPFNVAGGFTLDALGGAFVQEVHGDPSNVVGISLPTMRNLVTELGLNWTDLWNKN